MPECKPDLVYNRQGSRQAVSKWESGSALPSTEKLRSLSELYGVSADYLLNEHKQEVEKIAPLPQEAEDNLKTSCGRAGKISAKLFAIRVGFLIVYVLLLIGVLYANKSKEEPIWIDEMTGEGVTDVPKIEFDLEW